MRQAVRRFTDCGPLPHIVSTDETRSTNQESRAMVPKLLQLFSLSCRHKNTSQPFAAATAAPRNSSASWDPVMPAGRHYVVCLDCGKKFDYDWKEMRIVS
jgi:hypothetical protein